MVLQNKIEQLGQRLVWALSHGEGVRLGESTVISRRVHVVSPDKPEEVKIIGTDAGQLFYGRSEKGEIYHIDIFHQVGRVDHRVLAQVIMKVMHSQSSKAADNILDHMDIQTATGGGRLTGRLTFGRKASLRRAHANHVHLAAELSRDQLFFLIPVIAAVEMEIFRQGLEIRKVERINLDLREQKNSVTDLSAYTSESDSILREGREGDTTSRTAAKNTDCSLEEAHQLGTETLPPKELLHLLKLFPFKPKVEHRQRWGDLDHTLEKLRSEGYVEQKHGVWMLTGRGQKLRELIDSYLPELESKLRRFLRCLPASANYHHSILGNRQGNGFRRLRERLEVSPYNQGGQLNLSATVAQAAFRWIRGQSKLGCIDHESWRYGQPLRRKTAHIVLLVDSSASMAGDRLRAARMLAQHLILSKRNKVAVIAFQDDKVSVPAAFSSSLSDIQAQLLAMKATGLTPLAHALQETFSFLQRHRAHKPLVVLITDGIPTVPLTGGDPSADALYQAAKFKSLPLEFVCIGLNPNQAFLEELSKHSGGRLYVVKELETSVLAQLVHQELQRRRAY